METKITPGGRLALLPGLSPGRKGHLARAGVDGSATVWRIPDAPFHEIGAAGQPAYFNPFEETIMPQYFVAGYLPDDFDPSQADENMGQRIHALNEEMIAAGVRKFACGLGPAKALRAQTDGEVLITDGPYLEGKEHIGGFWILECANMDEALAWASKGVAATRGRVEVREIFFVPG